jgi:hypothetical protein
MKPSPRIEKRLIALRTGSHGIRLARMKAGNRAARYRVRL